MESTDPPADQTPADQTPAPDVLDALYGDCARRVGGIAYLVTGDEAVAARLVAQAFGNAYGDPAALARWPSTPESWVRAEVLRLAERPRVRLRLISLPVPPDERDVPVMFALADLPVRHRAALALHHVAGLAPAGVALETEATVGASAARIANAEELLAGPGRPFGADLPELLRGAARRAAVPLPGTVAARALPRRRTNQAVAMAGAGLLALAFAPAASGALAPPATSDVALAGAEAPAGGVLATARAQEATAERARQEARLRAFEARGALVLGKAHPRDATWTAVQAPADFLPHKNKVPKVSRPERAVKAKGVVEKAFVHDDRVFVSVARTEAKFGAKPRVYRVQKAAQVTVGRGLATALRDPAAPGLTQGADGTGPTTTMPLAQYLWLVEHSDAEAPPVVLEFDPRGQVTGIAEAKENRDS